MNNGRTESTAVCDRGHVNDSAAHLTLWTLEFQWYLKSSDPTSQRTPLYMQPSSSSTIIQRQ